MVKIIIFLTDILHDQIIEIILHKRIMYMLAKFYFLVISEIAIILKDLEPILRHVAELLF